MSTNSSRPPHKLVGIVRPGKKRGRTIGFPTANLQLHAPPTVLPCGSWAGWATVAGKQYKAATHVGARPTFEEAEVTIEVHLLDYEGPEFYGEKMEAILYQHLAPTKKFNSVKELSASIARYVQLTRNLSETPPVDLL